MHLLRNRSMLDATRTERKESDVSDSSYRTSFQARSDDLCGAGAYPLCRQRPQFTRRGGLSGGLQNLREQGLVPAKPRSLRSSRRTIRRMLPLVRSMRSEYPTKSRSITIARSSIIAGSSKSILFCLRARAPSPLCRWRFRTAPYRTGSGPNHEFSGTSGATPFANEEARRQREEEMHKRQDSISNSILRNHR